MDIYLLLDIIGFSGCSQTVLSIVNLSKSIRNLFMGDNNVCSNHNLTLVKFKTTLHKCTQFINVINKHKYIKQLDIDSIDEHTIKNLTNLTSLVVQDYSCMDQLYILKSYLNMNLHKLRIRYNNHLDLNMIKNIKCDNIYELDIEGCLQVNNDFLLKFPNLKKLNLTKCRQITNEAFKNKEKLEKLNITYCDENLNETIFSNLPNLKKINMYGCKQFKINKESFKNLPKLKYINISNCNKYLLETDFFTNLKSIKTIVGFYMNLDIDFIMSRKPHIKLIC